MLVGVCTYNEAANIEPMLQRLRAALPTADLLVVDDNSPDGTAERVRSFAAGDDRLRLIVRENQRGLGGAIRLALETAVDSGYDYFLNLDGDLSHDPDQLPELLRSAQDAPEVDVVIGSRYQPGGSIQGWPLRRKLMSRLVNRFATLCLGLPVQDCSGSMRCYRVDALRSLDLSKVESNGYAFLEELLVHLHRRGARMVEVPITFTERKHGHSKLTLREASQSALKMVHLALAVRGRRESSPR